MEKGNAKTAIIILVILIILAGGFLGYKIVENKNKNVETANEQNEENNVIITGISKKEAKLEMEPSKINPNPVKTAPITIDNLRLYMSATIPVGISNIKHAASNVVPTSIS